MTFAISNPSPQRAGRCHMVRWPFCSPACLLAISLNAAHADWDGVRIIRVEEDWTLHVATPDPVANAPQVVCVFGPADPDTDTHAVFEINHASMPTFRPGGMQLQCWWRDSLLGYGNHPNNREFDAAVDYITFTTVTELKEDRLYLEIIDGHSSNWGNFGGQGYLRLSLYTFRESLNNYNANHSIQHSRVAFGKHRMNHFARTEVRYYTPDGLWQTDEEDAVIFTQDIGVGDENVATTETTTSAQ